MTIIFRGLEAVTKSQVSIYRFGSGEYPTQFHGGFWKKNDKNIKLVSFTGYPSLYAILGSPLTSCFGYYSLRCSIISLHWVAIPWGMPLSSGLQFEKSQTCQRSHDAMGPDPLPCGQMDTEMKTLPSRKIRLIVVTRLESLEGCKYLFWPKAMTFVSFYFGSGINHVNGDVDASLVDSWRHPMHTSLPKAPFLLVFKEYLATKIEDKSTLLQYWIQGKRDFATLKFWGLPQCLMRSLMQKVRCYLLWENLSFPTLLN